MPGTTPNRGLPYPVSTDPLTAFPALMQQAMTNVDTHTHAYADANHSHPARPFRMCAGQTTVNMGNSGNATADIDVSAAGFTMAPIMIASVVGAAAFYAFIPSGRNNTTVKVGVSHRDGTSTTQSVLVEWWAIQMHAGQAAGFA